MRRPRPRGDRPGLRRRHRPDRPRPRRAQRRRDVERIVEDKDATDEERPVTEINAGLYAIDAAWLRRRIGDLQPSPTTGELYLTDLVAFAREDGRIVAALTVDDDGRLTGINDRSQLARAEWDMRVGSTTAR